MHKCRHLQIKTSGMINARTLSIKLAAARNSTRCSTAFITPAKIVIQARASSVAGLWPLRVVNVLGWCSSWLIAKPGTPKPTQALQANRQPRCIHKRCSTASGAYEASSYWVSSANVPIKHTWLEPAAIPSECVGCRFSVSSIAVRDIAP